MSNKKDPYKKIALQSEYKDFLIFNNSEILIKNYKKARSLFLNKNYIECIEILKNLSNNIKNTYKLLGSCYGNLKDFQLMLYFWNKAILKGDTDSIFYIIKYFINSRINFLLLEKYFKMGIFLKDKIIHLKYIEHLHKLKRFDEAEDNIITFSRLVPQKSIQLKLLWGYHFFKTKKGFISHGYYRQAFQINEDFLKNSVENIKEIDFENVKLDKNFDIQAFQINEDFLKNSVENVKLDKNFDIQVFQINEDFLKNSVGNVKLDKNFENLPLDKYFDIQIYKKYLYGEKIITLKIAKTWKFRVLLYILSVISGIYTFEILQNFKTKYKKCNNLINYVDLYYFPSWIDYFLSGIIYEIYEYQNDIIKYDDIYNHKDEYDNELIYNIGNWYWNIITNKKLLEKRYELLSKSKKIKLEIDTYLYIKNQISF